MGFIYWQLLKAFIISSHCNLLEDKGVIQYNNAILPAQRFRL